MKRPNFSNRQTFQAITLVGVAVLALMLLVKLVIS